MQYKRETDAVSKFARSSWKNPFPRSDRAGCTGSRPEPNVASSQQYVLIGSTGKAGTLGIGGNEGGLEAGPGDSWGIAPGLRADYAGGIAA